MKNIIKKFINENARKHSKNRLNNSNYMKRLPCGMKITAERILSYC